MWPVFPALDTQKVAAVLFVIAMTSARLLQPAFWQMRPVRVVVFAAFGEMLAGLAVWAAGRSLDHLPTVHAGAGLTYSAILITAPAILVLPVTALTDRLLSRLLLRSPAPAPAPASALAASPAPAPASLAPLPPPSLDPQSSGFDLTLSGHTHGGQLGLSGRSVLEMLRPGAGWWGTYARKRPDSVAARRTKLESTPSRLYTTSGFGHWFPSRLGCPTEMPIIVLERGQPEARAAAARAV